MNYQNDSVRRQDRLLDQPEATELLRRGEYGILCMQRPEGGGYGTFLHGLVVDMFHFPLVQGTWPDWMPWVGGTDFEFFRPVFNLADAAISVGIVRLILFNSKYLSFSGIEKSEAGQYDGNQEAKQ